MSRTGSVKIGFERGFEMAVSLLALLFMSSTNLCRCIQSQEGRRGEACCIWTLRLQFMLVLAKLLEKNQTCNRFFIHFSLRLNSWRLVVLPEYNASLLAPFMNQNTAWNPPAFLAGHQTPSLNFRASAQGMKHLKSLLSVFHELQERTADFTAVNVASNLTYIGATWEEACWMMLPPFSVPNWDHFGVG